ncbi:MAG: EF-hand domain-containing protein [Dechloromonas sp.]|uniref:EF-hand domain-containing protein n=1 Tax=Candidatus Dechloromonas phosphorivorans TaxID=2899244 RepID=A0A935K1K5_9RHOO|nr:EF-hand domain-containing protein [Candidatus Dechloromonas phosphorivorans]
MISGIGSSSQLSSKLFSALDTKSQGYLEKSDFVSAFSKISSASSSTNSSSASVDDVFSALDGNSDGKVTKDEFASTLAKLQEQFDSSRMQGGGHGGPQGAGGPPPPPPASDARFTKDELSSQLEEVSSSSESNSTELLSKIVNNFEAADTNSDGKVSFTEAMAYDMSSQNSTASDATTSTGSASNTNTSDAGVMMKIMQLMQAYGSGSEDKSSTLSSLLSVSA